MAALNSLGRAYAALDDRDKAVECYEQVLRIARQISNLRGERQTLKNLDEILKLSDVPLDPNDKTSGEKSPSQKLGKKSSPAKAKSTRNKPTRQRKPKP
ncbi:MAG: tetratricopeptide repeat-containing protein, partial [Acidobacteriota bacterium]|nr:tetratricopeptide repeat-containing protein [Acidobacteriota bacterium]